MSGRVAVIDFEHGMPSAEEARRRLDTELDVARRGGIAVLKIIHGYGSSGRGGRLRSALRTVLQRRMQEHTVGRVVHGEAWSIFDATTRALLDRYPALRSDADLERGNPGITLVEVRAGR